MSMLLGEYYKITNTGEERTVDLIYVTTLLAYLNHPNTGVFVGLLERLENEEKYMMCAGVHKAISKIEDFYDNRFVEVASGNGMDFTEPEEIEINISQDDYQEVLDKVFEDILIEVYEKQIDGYQKSSRERTGSED